MSFQVRQVSHPFLKHVVVQGGVNSMGCKKQVLEKMKEKGLEYFVTDERSQLLVAFGPTTMINELQLHFIWNPKKPAVRILPRHMILYQDVVKNL